MEAAQSPRTGILIVDDDGGTRELLRVIFETHGFLVLEAKDGQHALEMLGSDAGAGMSIVITDLVMPRVNGIQLCHAIRKNEKRAFVSLIFLITAVDNIKNLPDTPCFDGVFSKPVDYTVLVATVQQAYERSRLECN